MIGTSTKKNVIVIAGPTASGKSCLALELAKKIGGVIVNADSVQLYQGLPTLAAQPGPMDMQIVEHRLYGIFSPRERGTLFDWLMRTKIEIEGISNDSNLPIVVGGTGLYISRLLDGIILDMPDVDPVLRNELDALYNELGWDKFFKIVQQIDPESAAKISFHNRHRLLRVYEVYRLSGKKLSELTRLPNERIVERTRIFLINIVPARDTLYDRCSSRFKNMLANSALEEVREFIANYPDISGSNLPIGHTIGFCEISSYLDDKLSYGDMIDLVIKNTRHYAKRQYTWFKNQLKDVDHSIDYILTEDNVTEAVEEIISKL
ncbi:MAG: tRNA (adenosine(37)-N6)-dimethylallyltransferase MiaA [Rickettsiales bacterium]|nr:tRNA (adenosine(37)-N6)-dimethylallyltransferase MiaA [Rickettsiales bacterium]